MNEATEMEDLSDTDCDTKELADLPTDSEPEGTTGETSGEEQVLEGGPQRQLRQEGATVMARGGRRKNIKYKTEWGYGGTYSSRTKWC